MIDEHEIERGRSGGGQEEEPDVEAGLVVQAPVEVAAEEGAHLGLHLVPQLGQLLVSEAEGQGGDAGVHQELTPATQPLHRGRVAAPGAGLTSVSPPRGRQVVVSERRPPEPRSGRAQGLRTLASAAVTTDLRADGHQAGLGVLQHRHQLPGRSPHQLHSDKITHCQILLSV